MAYQINVVRSLGDELKFSHKALSSHLRDFFCWQLRAYIRPGEGDLGIFHGAVTRLTLLVSSSQQGRGDCKIRKARSAKIAEKNVLTPFQTDLN